MYEEFPRDHVYALDRVVHMETIGVGPCGSVKRMLVDGRLEAFAKVHTRARACACSTTFKSVLLESCPCLRGHAHARDMVHLGLYPGAC